MLDALGEELVAAVLRCLQPRDLKNARLACRALDAAARCKSGRLVAVTLERSRVEQHTPCWRRLPQLQRIALSGFEDHGVSYVWQAPPIVRHPARANAALLARCLAAPAAAAAAGGNADAEADAAVLARVAELDLEGNIVGPAAIAAVLHALRALRSIRLHRDYNDNEHAAPALGLAACPLGALRELRGLCATLPELAGLSAAASALQLLEVHIVRSRLPAGAPPPEATAPAPPVVLPRVTHAILLLPGGLAATGLLGRMLPACTNLAIRRLDDMGALDDALSPLSSVTSLVLDHWLADFPPAAMPDRCTLAGLPALSHLAIRAMPWQVSALAPLGGRLRSLDFLVDDDDYEPGHMEASDDPGASAYVLHAKAAFPHLPHITALRIYGDASWLEAPLIPSTLPSLRALCVGLFEPTSFAAHAGLFAALASLTRLVVSDFGALNERARQAIAAARARAGLELHVVGAFEDAAEAFYPDVFDGPWLHNPVWQTDFLR